MKKKRTPAPPPPGIFTLPKTLTGIDGLDEITEGGLPKNRPTLVCGGPGCGKTLMAVEFLVRGITEYNEPGVFMAFEETAQELTTNASSLGFDLAALQADKKLRLDHVHIDRAEIEETGEYDLEGLFIRLGHAIDSIGAKRVVLDTIEVLFAGLSNESVLRSEIQRLFRWLKDKGVTTIVTAERGEGFLTRQGLEEYVSDCVILLDNRVVNQITTRRLRIVKYRGSTHGTNEYPYIITADGLSVLPVTSLKLDYPGSDSIISTGIAALDEMFGRKGFYQGSSILVSGTVGTAKTILAASFAHEICRTKKRCLFFTFEESPRQLIRNMDSVGIDLQSDMDKGLLKLEASRPTLYGLERHLATMHKTVHAFKPHAVVIDPVSNLISIGDLSEVRAMLTRLIDFLKVNGITVLFTSLTAPHSSGVDLTEESIASLIDTWISLCNPTNAGERNREISILKLRGMAHSNQVREFVVTDHGIELIDVFVGPSGVVTGAVRLAQQMEDQALVMTRQQELERKDLELERRRQSLETTITGLRTEFGLVEDRLNRMNAEQRSYTEFVAAGRQRVAKPQK